MIGTSVQRYDILEELGQGGMSVVYRGRDTALNRDVAVKVLHSHLARKKENRRRFRREAQAIARLQHENIVDVYDYSRESDDASYIVMEYVPGANLRNFCREHGQPPPEVAAMIGVVIADALAHAHDHGVIHRDLKPENVMVSEDGSVKLMDFGIAHVADAETMTQTGSLLGSPAHMAPEIIDGGQVNARSDIFSLGTVLYWLSTGEFPFRGDNAPQVLRQVLECNFDPPDAVEPKLNRELSQVIGRCLSREPEDRFESVEALRAALCDSLGALGPDVDIEPELEHYFKDPADYRRDFEDAIVDRLVEMGHECMEEGRVPAAIAHFNRVLAYDPNNPEVEGALGELDESPFTPRRIALAVAACATVAVGVWFAFGPFETGLPTGDDPDGPLRSASRGLDAAVEAGDDRQQVGAARAEAVRAASDVRRRGESLVGRKSARRTGESLAEQRRSIAVELAIRAADARDIASARPAETETAANTPTGAARSPETGERENTPSDPADPADPTETGDGAEGTPDTQEKPEETFTYRFKISPLAATVSIDGRKMSAPRALRGVELSPGRHRIRVSSPGCHTYENTFRVDGPREDKMSIVLEWKDASIQVNTNHPAVVYLDGDTSQPYPIGADGKNARIRIPFGKVDPDRRTSRKNVTLEVRPRADLEVVRQRTVSLRPGDQTSIHVSFPSSRPP